MKVCACCGRTYNAATWVVLELVGHQVVPGDDEEPELVIELRNCPCPNSEIPSTLAVEVKSDGTFVF